MYQDIVSVTYQSGSLLTSVLGSTSGENGTELNHLLASYFLIGKKVYTLPVSSPLALLAEHINITSSRLG